MRDKYWRWYLFLTVTFLVWGTQHPPIKILSDRMSPVVFNLLRYSIACLALLPFVLQSRVKIEKHDWMKISSLGFVGIFLFGIINLAGVRLSTAANNAILLNSWPLLVVLVAPVFIREKATKNAVFGTILGFMGVVAVVTNGASVEGLIKSGFFRGNILIILSGLCIAVYSMFNKKYIEKYGGLNVTFYTIFAGSVMLLVYSILSKEILTITQISLNSLLLLLWVAVPTTAVTYVIWFRSIDRIGVVKTSPFFLLIPVSGVLTSAMFLGEKLTQYTVVGTLLILAGVWLVQKK